MRNILFVCVHNAGRSQMAEAFTNQVAAERGLPVRGLSAGTEMGTRVNPLAVEVMRELGISMEGQAPSSSPKRWPTRPTASSRWAAGSMPPRARLEFTSRRIGDSTTQPANPSSVSGRSATKSGAGRDHALGNGASNT